MEEETLFKWKCCRKIEIADREPGEGGGGAYLKGEGNYSMFSEMRSNISFCICLQINQEPRSQAEYFQLFYIGCMEKFFLQNIRIDF